jgi:hypothetical protein
VLAVGRAWNPTLVAALDAVVTHQTGDAVYTDPPALGAQGCMHARTAVDGSIVGMNATDINGNSAICA